METSNDKLKVLIVDDHAVLRDSIRMILGHLPDIVVAGEAGTGDEAIEACRSNAYDVVLLDIRLPDRPGLEVARVLKEERLGGKIIAFSMRDEETVREQMENIGVDAFVSKAADADVLIETIRSAARPGENR